MAALHRQSAASLSTQAGRRPPCRSSGRPVCARPVRPARRARSSPTWRLLQLEDRHRLRPVPGQPLRLALPRPHQERLPRLVQLRRLRQTQRRAPLPATYGGTPVSVRRIRAGPAPPQAGRGDVRPRVDVRCAAAPRLGTPPRYLLSVHLLAPPSSRCSPRSSTGSALRRSSLRRPHQRSLPGDGGRAQRQPARWRGWRAIQAQALVDASFMVAHQAAGFDVARLMVRPHRSGHARCSAPSTGCCSARSRVLVRLGIDAVFPAFFLLLVLDAVRSSSRLGRAVRSAIAAGLLLVTEPATRSSLHRWALVGLLLGAAAEERVVTRVWLSSSCHPGQPAAKASGRPAGNHPATPARRSSASWHRAALGPHRVELAGPDWQGLTSSVVCVRPSARRCSLLSYYPPLSPPTP